MAQPTRPEFTNTVVVRPLPEQSDPDSGQHAFAYTITIHNTGDVTAQLREGGALEVRSVDPDDVRLVLAGPCPAVDSPTPGDAGFSGSLIVAEFDSLDEARRWADDDPFVAGGVYRHVEVKPFVKAVPR